MDDETERGPLLTMYDGLPWSGVDAGSSATPEMLEGVRRKLLVRGEEGYHVKVVEMPPGHVIAPHHHSASEVMVVLEGSIDLDQLGRLGPLDSVVIPARRKYGFTVGDDGVRFMIVRTRPATMAVVG